MTDSTRPARADEALIRLRRILQALAMPGERQKALFPELVVLGEELALEFDDWYHALVGGGGAQALPAEAQTLLAQIDSAFDRMVDGHEHVWSAQGVAEREEWAAMRDLAARALECLGWPREDPGAFDEGHARG